MATSTDPAARQPRRRPREQRLYRPLRSTDDAARIWQVSQELTRVPFGSAGTTAAEGAPAPGRVRQH